MRTALVTGAAGGIGTAALRAFEEHGFEVVGVDREQADLTRGAEVAAVLSPLERLDVVFTAHGMSGRALGDGPVEACTEEAWDAVLAANLRSVFLVCKHAVPKLRVAGGGAIVTLSSVVGLVGDQDFATHAYAASKGGVISLTRAMAVAYAKDAIRCNVICPGLIETPMSRRAQQDWASAPGCPSSTRSPVSSGARRTSPRRLSTSRRRLSLPAPCSRSTAAGPRADALA